MSSIEPIRVPKWGLSMEEGKIVDWHVKEGELVNEGDELVDIETTKITNVCEAHTDGLLRKIVAEEGQTLPVGALIAVMAGEDVADAEIDAFVAKFEEQFDPNEVDTDGTGLEISSVNIGAAETLRVGIAGTDKSEVPIVLLHGFGGDLENWSLVQEGLVAEHPVYSVELPGHGESSKSVGAGKLSDLADAITEAIDSLKLDKFVIAGHSLGGAVAVEVAARLNQRVLGLGLVCPAAMPGGTLSSDYVDAFVNAKRARDLRAPIEILFENSAMVTRDMLDGLAKMKRLDGAFEALSTIKDNLKGGDPAYSGLGDRLAGIVVPALLINTSDDRIVGSPDITQLPGTIDILEISGGGHMPHLENSSEVVVALLDLAKAHKKLMA